MELDQLQTAMFLISNGEFDSKLDDLEEIIRLRKRSISQRNVATLNVGDKVRVKNCSPKYVVGAIATVTEKKGNKVSVQLPKLNGKFSNSIVVLKPEMLEPYTENKTVWDVI